MSSPKRTPSYLSSFLNYFICFCLLLLIIIPLCAYDPVQAQSRGFLELTNESALKIIAIKPVAEYFKTEKSKDKKKSTTVLDIYKTGYEIKLQNRDKKNATVKIEMILDYLAEGDVFSYITYDVVNAKQSKSVYLMCDNIPVECTGDSKDKDQKKKCEELALGTWDRHVKKVIVSQLK